jgi:hypothetical protein
LGLVLFLSLVSASRPRALAFCDAHLNDYESRFHSYSVNPLCLVEKQTLHNLLGSPSLRIKMEKALLDTLLDRGPDDFRF